MDILLDIPNPELTRVVDYCESRKIPLIIGMDSNAHSPAWGERELNKRGDLLNEWITTKNLHLANQGRISTFVPAFGARDTIIDVTLTNTWAVSLVYEWEVD